MHSRRRALISLASLPLAAAAWRSRAAEPKARRTVSFAPGDVAVGCTLLNNPKDDHAGRGRILHYDSNLKLRSTLWLNDTTHIVQGMAFGPDRTLWAFDSFAYKIVRIGADGHRRDNFTQAPPRSFAHISFASDGRFFMGENYVGEKSRVPLRTTLPFMPGTRRLGDGHLFEFSAKAKLLREHATPVHGGMGGFQGLTAAALTPDAKSVVYTSESGPKIFHFDLLTSRPLANIADFADNTGKFFFDVAFDSQGRLLVVRGTGVDALDMQGKVLQRYPLQGFGWASMSRPVTANHVYVTNFFSGDIAKLDLASGAVLATANTGIKKSLSGAAEMPPA